MTFFCTTAPNDDDLAVALGSVIRCPIATDIGFWGVSDNDSSIRVAVERKKIGDLAACILDGRYLHQAQIAKQDGLDILCLVVEGRVRSNPDDGLLEVPVWGLNPRTNHRCEQWQPVRPTMMYSRFDQFLTELDYLLGVIVKRSENVRETAAIIKALWLSFQKPPDDHQSLHHIYQQPNRAGVLLVPPGLVRRVGKELGNVGWERSRAVAEHFKSVREMANAPVSEWRKIEGIGKKTAESVVRELSGGDQ